MSSQDVFDAFVENLRRAFFALRGVSAEMSADLDCNPVERGVLRDLDENGPETVPALADRRAVTRQAMLKTADRLISRGLLCTRPNPRHQRSHLLALTPDGKKLLGRVLARERRLLSKAELPVTDADLRKATQVLGQLTGYFVDRDRTISAAPRRGGSR
jgi:DNA-binding MarR family transcriptional regulator